MSKETAESIIKLVEDEKPENVEKLLELAVERLKIQKEEAIKLILKLHGEGKIKLTRPPKPLPSSLINFLRTEAPWYWIIVSLTVATSITVSTIPEDAFPLVYIRYLLGIIFVLWLPGYSFIKALFPPNSSFKSTSKNLDSIERIALSIGMSLALVPIVGLLLNYTPWGIRLTPIILSLLSMTMIFATVGVIREYEARSRALRK